MCFLIAAAEARLYKRCVVLSAMGYNVAQGIFLLPIRWAGLSLDEYERTTTVGDSWPYGRRSTI